MTLLDLVKSGKNYTIEEIAGYLFSEMEMVMDEEYEKEQAKLPKKEPPKDPKTQAERCAVGRHGNIVDGNNGDICADCGFVTRFYFG